MNREFRGNTRYIRIISLAAFGWLVFGLRVEAGERIGLEGHWAFRLDPDKVGVEQRWFDSALPEKIRLPGSADEAKLTPPNTEPPSLAGLYRLHKYIGPAWYQRDVEAPGDWKGKRVLLLLERTHWETQVWVDAQAVGARDSLVAPHVYDLGTGLAPGRHRLTIRVDNTPKFDLGHFPSVLYEGTQTNWNGLIGRLELQGVDPVSIEDIQVYPDVEQKQVKVRIRVANVTGRPVGGSLKLSAERRGDWRTSTRTVEFKAPDTRTTVLADLPMGNDVRLWDEFSTELYDLEVTLSAKGDTTFKDEKKVCFGMRKLAATGTQFTLNDRPVFLRGTLECGIFPLTGYPPMDAASWRRIYRIIKSYGLNGMRFHSWCPPEAAFAAADEEGVMLHVEAPQANVKVGAVPERDRFIAEEVRRILDAYGTHPSFCLLTMGNELTGEANVLAKLVEICRKEDPRHLYTSATSGLLSDNRQFTVAPARGLHGEGTDSDFRERVSKADRPIISHEVGQWTVYPNLDEMKKYTGVVQARNFALVRDDLAAKHMLDLAPRFLEATGRHMVLLYKEEIEGLLRTPGHAGFELLDLHDYPGQGTALVGLLNPFWDSKGLISPEAYRRFCGPTVPLLRLKRRTFAADESIEFQAEVAHFGPSDLAKVEPIWGLVDERGHKICWGALRTLTIPTGKLTPLGEIRMPLSATCPPCKMTVTLALEGTPFKNAWDFWVYPPNDGVSPPADVLVVDRWKDALSALHEGKKVLFMATATGLARTLPGRFTPVFWSPVWFKERPGTMGILCDPKHPALAEFPTAAHSDWQWLDIVQRSRTMILDDTPPDFRPIVQVIDNFSRNHRLGCLFEARVGTGKLMACSLKLSEDIGNRPAARQLAESIYHYMGSDRFQPRADLDEARLSKLFAPLFEGVMRRLSAKVVHADSEAQDYPASNVLDGNPETIWHTPWGQGAPGFPHEIVLEFPAPVAMAGCKLLPRQDMRNGWIKDYALYVSSDGKSWGRPGARGAFDRSDEMQTVYLKGRAEAKFMKLVALSAFDGQPFASLAEIEIVQP